MADAKKCDRCGKLFEPYNIDNGCKVPKRYMNILLRNTLIDQLTYKEPRDYDLCKECNDSFLKWLSKPRIVKHDCSNFGNIDKQNHACKICQRYQECEEATKEKKEAKQKGCNVFGAFDESVDCLMCPQCDECKEVANSIKEASSNGE